MQTGQSIVRYSINHPKAVILIMVAMTIAFGALIPFVKVDTDPENMLSEKEAVRVFHHDMKREFAIHDMVILGIVNETDPDGVFNPDSLAKIYDLTTFAKGLRWPDPKDPDREEGVIEIDLLAPSTVDSIEPAGAGAVRFEWLMPEPPKTREEARRIRDNARNNPLLNGTLLSEDGKALALYIPLTSKDLSYRVYSSLKKKIATLKGDERYYITGLPVAEDTFGVQMFVQMAISAPLAMLAIFILMLLFFRKLVLIVSPMIVAVVSVIWTMGFLIGTGNKVHIMSSMIPIFIMPIAVLDSIHILSEFFDRYQATRDSRKTSMAVMETLFRPMLYTSLTSAAGFASLALTPIPPVQVFGVFVAIGIMFAWVLTITFVPAYTTLIGEKSLETFGLARGEEGEDSILTRILKGLGGLTYRRAKVILSITVIAGAVAFYGISLIQINDNPVKWFTRSHPIRVADEVLNSHFGGTYMAYLVLEPKQAEQSVREVAGSLDGRLRILKAEMHADFPEALPVIEKFRQMVRNSAQEVSSGADLLDLLLQRIAKRMDTAPDDELEALEEIVAAFDSERAAGQTFKRPDVLRYMARLQDALLETEVVGKSNAVTDIVKKVYKELMEGKEEYYRIPDTLEAVAQTLITFQSSHNPDDLWHLVTPDYGKANIWVQLKSGDNKDMERVTKAVDLFFQKNPAPIALGHRWFGMTYINVVWQNKMVSGMLKAFLGSFLVVFIMMTVLFRSPLWGALSMIPLTVTVALIYGVIGFIGKDYDMPVAVLSALTLGLAVDFSIHFLTRSRMAAQEHGSWELASRPVFGEPARAISRNIVVIAIGFLPLLAAPLMPYKTVGVFMAAILIIAGVATLFILPALMRVLARFLFLVNAPRSAIRDFGACFVISTATVILIALSIHQFGAVSRTILTWLSIILISILTLMCSFMSSRVARKTSDGR